MDKITLALDWTPNINHIGFFVAKAKGYYRDAGLDVQIIDPSADNYEITPAKKVELGQADFALCPTESIISYRTKSSPFPLKAIAAVFQTDLSAIVVRADSGIYTPSGLDGKSYASYKARYEDRIVKEMIRNAGGKGDIRIEWPEKLGIWETLVNGTYDASWIFTNWEGLAAEADGLLLRYFKMEDFGIPYSYSPVLAADEQKMNDKKFRDAYIRFLSSTSKGFDHTVDEPAEAALILQDFIPEIDSGIDLNKALGRTAAAIHSADGWGYMQSEKMQAFVDWLKQTGLEENPPAASELFDNSLLTSQKRTITE
ncbi:MAG: ABC transporter substrate-binding protein [Balneolales bacterium]|nr:ABC transporter substrate-binding protein [Balneolales bacterium]